MSKSDVFPSTFNAMPHWLAPLLSPGSIAIVGASANEGSLAASTHRQLVDRGYKGVIFSVNPKYENLHGSTCYASLLDLPAVPDLVVFAISGLVLEKCFYQAVELKVGGIVIYAANFIENDTRPRLTERLRHRAAEAGIPVCGGNSMGFYNYDDKVFVSFDSPPCGRPKGNIGLILHSGSGMTYLANNDARFCFNYVIASAQETNATVGDYMDYLLDQSSTRVIAILLEAVRDVPVFVAALKKAREKAIPVVITRLGRTEKSAQLAMSHSGAIVGNHEAFVAVCERYGVILCNDADEMIITAMLFGAGFRVSKGRLASMLDSGGMREQMIDLAEDHGVEFAQISTATTAVLRGNLETGLEAVNPMDGMGALGRDTAKVYLECGKALLDDADTGLLSFEFEFRDGFSHYPELFGVVKELAQRGDKPVLLINSCSFADISNTATELIQQGVPVINGIDVALRSIRNLVGFNPEAEYTEQGSEICFDSRLIGKWTDKLKSLTICDEITSLALMSDFGLPVVDHQTANCMQQVIDAAESFGYPLVIKTAEPGIMHKSDSGGVKVGIEDRQGLEIAYQELSSQLGNHVVVMPMVESGIEVSVGMKNDPQYGPLVVVACGGVLIELLSDRAFGLAPLDGTLATEMIDQLKLARLLDGVRGQAAADRNALIDLMVRFSELVCKFTETIAEIDLNPVIVKRSGCTIVDALVIPKN
jgi:acyl-CoA synthetase (NDP forming)